MITVSQRVLRVGLTVTFLAAIVISSTQAQIPAGSFPSFPNVRVSLPGYTDPEEVSITINPTDPLNLAAGANIRYYYYSTNGGLNWSQGQLSSTYGVWGDPCLVFDALGNLYFGHLSNPPSPGYWIDRIVVQRSTNGGAAWNSGVGIGFSPPRKNQDKEWLAADMTNSPYRHYIYAAWTEFDAYGSTSTADSTRILFSRSTDSGLSWSTPVRVSDHGGDCIDADNTVEGAVPAVGPNGEVYTSWSGPLGIMFDKSTDGGATFGADVYVTSQPGGWDFGVPGIYRCNGMPVTACDVSTSAYRGNVYILWSDQRNGLGDTDVFFIKSTDGGATWGPVKRVNDDLTATQQFFPWMTIDQTTGYIYAVFYDRRNTVGNATEVWMARSTDGGETFTNFRVSESSFTPNSAVFFGDYTNIAASDGKVYPIWMRLDGNALSVWLALVTDSASITRQYPVERGWNIVSVPMTAGDYRCSVLFPTAISQAFEYTPDSGYVVRDTLKPGGGYWLQFAVAENVSMTGMPISIDTIDVHPGWNLIGSVAGTIQTSAIQQVPSGILESPYFRYSSAAYEEVTTLEPARGYWVKAISAGQLILQVGNYGAEISTADVKPVRTIGKRH